MSGVDQLAVATETASPAAPKPTESYRASHLAKGEDYHRLFAENPYARLLWELEREVLDRIVSAWRPNGGIRHLDFACGTGRIIGHLRRQTKESVGVDVSASMQAVARRAVPDARFLLGDITTSPLLDGERFDLVTAFRFFLNAEPELRLAAMRKLASLMHPGSRLVFNNHRNAGSLTHRLLLAARPRRTDLHYMSHAEVAALLDAAGLRIVRVFHLGVLPGAEQRMPLPLAIMRPMERIAAKVSVVRSLANDIIYVCQRA
jgi:SAM-dependent methyltransferase